MTVTASGGNATAGTDFTAGPYTVTFADGQAQATLTIPIAADSLTEGNETTILTLSASNNGSVRGAQATTTLTITDVPPTPTPNPNPNPNPNPAPAPSVRRFAVAVGGGAGAVNLYDAKGGLILTFNPYGANYTGGVNVAVGDINRDGVDDIVTGVANGVTHVKAFDGVTGAELYSFFAYGPDFVGSVSVAVGDLDGDGYGEIVTGASANGHVKAFDGRTGAEVRSFFAYAGYTGGVNVAAGDVNRDGRADIVTGVTNGLTHVKAFDGRTNAEIRSFYAYGAFVGSVSVAVGDLDGDGFAEIVTGASANGHVKAFDGNTGNESASFFAYPGFAGAARVGAGDADGDGRKDILTGAGPGGGPNVKAFRGTGFGEILSFFAFDSNDLRGVYVG